VGKKKKKRTLKRKKKRDPLEDTLDWEEAEQKNEKKRASQGVTPYELKCQGISHIVVENILKE